MTALEQLKAGYAQLQQELGTLRQREQVLVQQLLRQEGAIQYVERQETLCALASHGQDG